MSDFDLLNAVKTEIEQNNNAHFPSEFSAFEMFLSKYEKLVYHIARRYFLNTYDAQDASQEAIIRIYRGIPNVTIEKDKNLKAWICTVTARTCLSILRKKHVETEAVLDDFSFSTSPSAEEDTMAILEAQNILNAMKKLKPIHRMILILRDIEGLGYEEIAEALHISIGTVKSRISRAREALKLLL